MSQFATSLNAAMESAGLSASELAAKAGITESAVSLLRAGRREPSYRTLQRLTSVLPATCRRRQLTASRPSIRLLKQSRIFARARWSSCSTTRIVKTKATW